MHLSDLSARSGPETNVVQSWVATPAIGMIDGIRAVRATRGQPRRQPPHKLSAFSTYRVAAPSRISSPAPPYCHSARAHAVPRTGPSGLAQATQDWRHRFDEGVQPPTAPPAADGELVQVSYSSASAQLQSSSRSPLPVPGLVDFTEACTEELSVVESFGVMLTSSPESVSSVPAFAPFSARTRR